MNLLAQFALHNLLPAMVAGAVSWLAIYAGIEVLGIRHGKLRLCLLTAPLIKSTLVLLGMHQVLPWPDEIFGAWHAQALPSSTVLPPFLVATGLALAGRGYYAARARRVALGRAVAPLGGEGRLAAALDTVMTGYKRNQARISARCGCEFAPQRPELRIADASVHSPLIVTDGRPTIVFPKPLVARLSEHELQGALAHEVAHLQVRAPLGCFSSEWIRALVAVNPMAGLMASQLEREEEKACDDIAVAAIGDPDAYAGMLLKSYRFANETSRPLAGALQYLPQLLGVKPALSERIERLIDGPAPQTGMGMQYAAFALLWSAVVSVFFVG